METRTMFSEIAVRVGAAYIGAIVLFTFALILAN
jgi:hypothetical protein